MSQSYIDTLPTDRDKARSILGVTDVSTAEAALVSDEYIDAVLTWKAGLDGAVAFIAGALAARYAQLPTSVSASGKSVSWAERVKHWQLLSVSAGAGAVTGSASLTLVPLSYGVDTEDEFARPPDYWP